MGAESRDAVVLASPGNERIADTLASALGLTRGAAEVRRFPDGETYVRIDTPPRERTTVLVCTLRHPDDQLVRLLLLAATARDLGARRVGLVAPYLAYLRQDARFRPGEGLTSAYVGRLLSASVDWLVTVDPHLHRHASLLDVYQMPTTAVSAAPAVAAWLRAQVDTPLLVGPDAESAQWAGDVAQRSGAPWVVLEKRRHGDRDIEVSVPDVERWRNHTPVLVDDIISTGRTMAESVGGLQRAGLRPPICVGVHAVFADGAEAVLARAGAGRVVTCDTIAHATNAIGVMPLVAAAIRRHL